MNARIKNNRTFYNNTRTWVYTNTLHWELIGTVTWVYTNTLTWELIGKDNGLTWVYTNTHTWEIIGKDDGLTWVNTNTPTWERIGTVTWVYTNTLKRELNRYGPDRTGPDQTDRQTYRHTLNLSFYRKIEPIVFFLERVSLGGGKT